MQEMSQKLRESLCLNWMDTVKYCIVKNVGVNPVIFGRVHYMKRLIKIFSFLCNE